MFSDVQPVTLSLGRVGVERDACLDGGPKLEGDGDGGPGKWRFPRITDEISALRVRSRYRESVVLVDFGRRTRGVVGE